MCVSKPAAHLSSHPQYALTLIKRVHADFFIRTLWLARLQVQATPAIPATGDNTIYPVRYAPELEWHITAYPRAIAIRIAESDHLSIDAFLVPAKGGDG
jgi:hypothetical protein